MITVRELKERIQFCIDHGYLSDDDFLYLLGSGDKQSGYIDNIIMPGFIPKKSSNDDKGYFEIGFVNKKHVNPNIQGVGWDVMKMESPTGKVFDLDKFLG